jgi:4-diphosphocytidyl-2-C-methyl-D-erythritol kinase
MHRHFSVPPVEVVLLKNIPVGSGLGGGSSDAAFFLKGLNDYFHLNLSDEKLSELALSLGSDVPFFLTNRPALVTGRGESVSPLQLNLGGLWLVIVFPRVSFFTAGMFSLLKPEKPEISPKEIVRLPVNQWSQVLINDFEKVAFDREPALAAIKDRLLLEGALVVSLTGTGSALFGIYKKEPETASLSLLGEVFKYKMG